MISPGPLLLPTSRSPPNWPQLAGAMVSPQGEFRCCPVGSSISVLMNVPFVVYSSTIPPGGRLIGICDEQRLCPVDHERLDVECRVAAWKNREIRGSVKLPVMCHSLLKTSMLPLFWSAANNWAAPVDVFPIASPVNEAPTTFASIVELAPPFHAEIEPSRLSKMNEAWAPFSWKVRRRARGDPRRGGAHLSRRSVGAARGSVSLVRDSHDQLHTGGARGLRATHTVDRRSPRPTEVGSLVGNPEWARGRER